MCTPCACPGSDPFQDDNGKVYNRTVTVKGVLKSLGPAQIDWRVEAAREWWVAEVTQAHDGGTLFDGLLVDGADTAVHLDNKSHFMSWANEKALIQSKMDSERHHLYNSRCTVSAAHAIVPTIASPPSPPPGPTTFSPAATV